MNRIKVKRIFVSFVAISCILFGGIACKPIHTIQKNQQQKNNDIIQNILHSCHRKGMMDADTIRFQKEPSCEKVIPPFVMSDAPLRNPKNAICVLRKPLPLLSFPYECYPKHWNQNADIELHCQKMPAEFSVYRNLTQKTDPSFLQKACRLDMFLPEITGFPILEKDHQVSIVFVNTKACQQATKVVFTSDWPGLLDHGCRLYQDTEHIRINCQGKILPEELHYFETDEAQLDGYLEKVSLQCKPEGPITNRSLFFQKNSHCKHLLKALLSVQGGFEENQGGSLCTITEDSLLGGIQFFCEKQIPNKLVQAVTGHSLADEMKKIPPSVTKECKRVGSASKNRMAFTEDPVCQDALLSAMDMDASFQKNECLITKEEDLLNLSCQKGLPLLLTPFTSKIATDEAYLLGITEACQVEGALEKDKIHFLENLLCIDRLKDALRNQWSPLVKAQCELVLDPLQSDLQVTLSCRKGVPQNILSAFMESLKENK